MKRVLRNTATAVAVILIGGFAINYLLDATIPKLFFETRISAAGAANNLAVLINNSLANLKRIEQFENENGNEQALELLSFEIEKKQEKQNAAVLLASNLDNMAKAANEIAGNRARSLAIEAVTSGVSMVSRIINYNSTMDQLFISIQQKIASGNSPTGTNIRALISSLNSDAKSINELNIKFNEALKEFDSRYGKG